MANRPIEPVANNEACEQVIHDTYNGTLVMCEENIPYAVPINHAYVDGKFYFHCGMHGRKLDLIRRNPNVVYVINKYHGEPKTAENSKECHGPWESLLAYGTARVVDEGDEKVEAFTAFMRYYGSDDFQMSEQARNNTSAIVMDVTSMTVRAELNRGDTVYWLWSPEGEG